MTTRCVRGTTNLPQENFPSLIGDRFLTSQIVSDRHEYRYRVLTRCLEWRASEQANLTMPSTHNTATDRATEPPSESPQARSSLLQRVSENGWALAEQGTQSALNFITIFALTILVGFEAAAIYQMGRFVFLLIAGIQNSLVSFAYTINFRSVAAERLGPMAGCHLIYSLAMGIGSAILCGLVAILPVFDSDIRWMLAALAIAIPAWMIREFFRRHEFAHLRPATAFWFATLASVIQLAILIALYFLDSLNGASVFLAIGFSSIAAIVPWFSVRRQDFEFSMLNLKEQAWENWALGKWIFAGQTLTDLLLTAIQWILVLSAGKAAGGAFAIGFQLISLCNPVATGLSNMVPPRFASIVAENSTQKLLDWTVKFNRWFLALLAAIGCGVVVFSPLLFRILKKVDQPWDSHPWHLLIVLALSFVAQAAGITAFHGLNILRKPEANMWPRVIGILLAIGFLVLCGAQWGALGAAYTLLLANIVISALTYARFRQTAQSTESFSNESFGPK